MKGDISPDLDWMLQSGQVSDIALLDALAGEHADALLRVAGLILSDRPGPGSAPGADDPVYSREVVSRALAYAVVYRHLYWGDMPLQSWLASLVAAECRRIQSWRKWQRWLPLHTLASRVLLPSQDISILERAQAHIFRLREKQRLSRPVRQAAVAGLALFLLGMGWLGGFLSPRAAGGVLGGDASTPTRHATITALPPVNGVFFYSTADPRDLFFTPTPVTPVSLPPALSIMSDGEAILARLSGSSSLWHTLWADAEIIEYGPPGYIGPSLEYRNQLWASQPGQVLALGGLPSAAPDYLRIVLSRVSSGSPQSYEMDLVNQVAYYPNPTDLDEQQAASNLILGYARSFPKRNRPYGFYLPHLLHPPIAWLKEGELRVNEQAGVSGRPSLMLDHWIGGKPRDRLWIDAQTGLILAWRKLDPDVTGLVVQDIFLTALALEGDFPRGFFLYQPSIDRLEWGDLPSPLNGIKQALPSAFTPAARPTRPVPTAQVTSNPGATPSNDFSRLPLTFQWSTDPDASSVLASQADLFGGDRFLGRFEIGNPWTLRCERSPDGRLLAFLPYPNDPFRSTLRLRMIDLLHPQALLAPFPDGSTGGDMAFSPDSRSLAVFGCPPGRDDCGVYLYDFPSSKMSKLIDLATAAYFTWSPDEIYLAMLGAGRGSNLGVIVARASSGEIVYTGEFDWQTMQAATSSPTHGWGAAFPPPVPGLDGCSRP